MNPADWLLPPALIMIIGALVLPLLPRKGRSAAFLFIAFTTLALVLFLPDGSRLSLNLLDYQLVPLRVDALSRVFGMIFAFIALAGGIYAFHITETGQQVAALLYAGGALGVTFAGDYLTLFVFWELMAFTSVYLIWARRQPESDRAGFRYLLFHVLGGGILFAGILLTVAGEPDLAISRLAPGSGPASWLILVGVIINAAVPPLHAWLSDAYPKATVTGAVFLSAFTTKSAVYVLVRIFPGWEILLILGTIMTLYGVFFAVLSNDIREILAYHIISQVGYMVAGVGIGTEMALNGTTAHAFSHILYKALLFMGAGTVLFATGKSKLTDLGGLARRMPAAMTLYMIAAFSISGFPLFNGFISKSMVVSAAGEAHHNLAMLLMLLAAVGTFLSVGLKLPYFTWFAKKSPAVEKLRPLPPTMLAGMAVVAFLCILYGIAPGLLYRYLPYAVHWNPFTLPHLVETVQILTLTFITFWIFRRALKPKPTIALDIDWLYRRPAGWIRRQLVDRVDDLFTAAENLSLKLATRLSETMKNPYRLATRTSADYTPDRYRPPAQILLLAVVAIFIFITVLALIA